MHRYLVIIEEADGNYSACAPDHLGCVATGPTREETEERMREAIAFHLEGLREDGMPVPDARTYAAHIAV